MALEPPTKTSRVKKTRWTAGDPATFLKICAIAAPCRNDLGSGRPLGEFATEDHNHTQ